MKNLKMKQQSALKAWVARDKDGMLYLYTFKPRKSQSKWLPNIRFDLIEFIELSRESFPEVKWEDEEPTEIELSIHKKDESKKSVLSSFCRIALFVSILSCTVIGILHVIQWIIRQTFLT